MKIPKKIEKLKNMFKELKDLGMLEKLKKVFKEHPFRMSIAGFVGLIIVPIVIVHILYTIPAPVGWLEYKIPPGNLLAYIGTVMTFCATFSLSVIVYISNKDKDKREYLLKNRIFINIDKNQEIKIEIIDLERNDYADIFIKVNIGLVSEVAISGIRMNFISIDEREIGKMRKCFSKDFSHKPEMVTFPRMDNKLIEASFPLSNVDKNVAKFLKESKNFMIAIDVDFICEGVKTPYTINLGLKAKGEKDEGDIAYIYSLDELYFHYQSPDFK